MHKKSTTRSWKLFAWRFLCMAAFKFSVVSSSRKPAERSAPPEEPTTGSPRGRKCSVPKPPGTAQHISNVIRIHTHPRSPLLITSRRSSVRPSEQRRQQQQQQQLTSSSGTQAASKENPLAKNRRFLRGQACSKIVSLPGWLRHRHPSPVPFLLIGGTP